MDPTMAAVLVLRGLNMMVMHELLKNNKIARYFQFSAFIFIPYVVSINNQ